MSLPRSNGPGVLAVYTAADLGDYWCNGPLLVPPPPVKGLVFHERTLPILVRDKVRHLGEPIAVIVAESRYIAEDALEDVLVSYEPLPAVTDLEAALTPESQLVHDDLESNLASHVVQEKGDYAEAAAQADVILEAQVDLRSRNSGRAGKPGYCRRLERPRRPIDRLGHDPGADPDPQWAGPNARSI